MGSIGIINSKPAMRTFTFRQPQRISPLALRRLQLQDIESQRREEIAAGNQELRAMQEMTRLEQEEYKIRQQLATERQVSSASREIAKLDPLTSPDYMMKYAEVMSRHPLAANNKFLNEAFTHGMEVNQKVVSHKFAEMEEVQKQSGRENMEWLKAAGRYAALGGDPSTIATNPDGTHNFNGLFAAEAKIRAEHNARAEEAKKGLEVKRVVDADGKETVTYEAKKPDLTPAQKLSREVGTAGLQGRQEITTAQNETLKKQLNDPKSGLTDDQKKNIQAKIDANDANLGAWKGQLDVLHGAGFGNKMKVPEQVLPGTETAPVSQPSQVDMQAPTTTQQMPAPLKMKVFEQVSPGTETVPVAQPSQVDMQAPATTQQMPAPLIQKFADGTTNTVQVNSPPAAQNQQTPPAPPKPIHVSGQEFGDQWRALTDRMAEASSRAERHRSARDEHEKALDNITGNPFTSEFWTQGSGDEHVKGSSDAWGEINKAEHDYREASKARSDLLQKRISGELVVDRKPLNERADLSPYAPATSP